MVFRADASPQIGTGHLVRCRTLALALRERGAEVEFVCREHSGHLMGDLLLGSIPVTLLPAPEISAKGEDYATWLGLPQEADAAQTIGALKGGRPDWIVADHYGLDVAWERLLKPHCGQIFVIDDLGNWPHGCNVLLDQNYFANARSRYTALVPHDCRLLLGPEYALLRPEYAALRRRPSPRGAINRVLVFFGGSDLRNLTGMALEALSSPNSCSGASMWWRRQAIRTVFSSMKWPPAAAAPRSTARFRTLPVSWQPRILPSEPAAPRHGSAYALACQASLSVSRKIK